MSSWLSSSACPTPATLPWPKMPNVPAISRCSTPSRSEYWLARNRIRAWATVSLIRGTSSGHPDPRSETGAQPPASRPAHGQPRIHVLALPGFADPGVGRVVGEAPLALAGAGHHVQVVEVVAGRGHRRAVVAGRQQHVVAGADLLEDVDARAVRALVGEAAVGDLEVVDLLERGLDAGDVLVVLVRRIGRPVAARRDHLDRDQAVGEVGVRAAEVVDLAAHLPGAAELDRDLVDVARLAAVERAGGRQRDAAGGADLHARVTRRVDEVGRAVPDAGRGRAA